MEMMEMLVDTLGACMNQSMNHGISRRPTLSSRTLTDSALLLLNLPRSTH